MCFGNVARYMGKPLLTPSSGPSTCNAVSGRGVTVRAGTSSRPFVHNGLPQVPSTPRLDSAANKHQKGCFRHSVLYHDIIAGKPRVCQVAGHDLWTGGAGQRPRRSFALQPYSHFGSLFKQPARIIVVVVGGGNASLSCPLACLLTLSRKPFAIAVVCVYE